MKRLSIFPFIPALFLVFLMEGCKKVQVHQPVGLRCEYLNSPLGVDTNTPRFTWKMNSADSSFIQEGYRVFVGTDSVKVGAGTADVWDSQKVTGASSLINYEGDSLKPFTKYYWSVQIWSQHTESPISKPAGFETGMMGNKNWHGQWITDTEDVKLKPAAYYRRPFQVSKKVKSARAYIAVAGLYELSINGKKIGDHVLDPMYTRFDKRNLYVTYDITSHLKSGDNVVGVLLGNGWYNHQSTAVWDFHKAGWRKRPRFCMDMRITYEDNTTETITTTPEWKTSLSPVIFNSIYTAEHYDANKEQPDWNTPAFDESKWHGSLAVAPPSTLIVSQQLEPIRAIEEVKPKTLVKVNDKKYIFDLGRNIAGVSRITVSGIKGTHLRLRHAEVLDSTGNVNMSNIDVHYRPIDETDPFQTDIFILSGKKDETFSPRFNYKGFQYVEVTSDQPVSLTKESLTGISLHSDVSAIGSITSSNDMINKLWQATNNSYLSNLFGYPTDCPQREKNGWTGDAHIASETGLYNFDAITIYEKWMADHRDEQQPDGVLPSIIPTAGWGYEWGNGPDWTSTIAIIPWNVYLFYGDKKLLADCYDNIKKYVDHISEKSPAGLTDWGLGDWVPVKSVTPKELTSSLYYYTDASILAKAAKLLDKVDDFKKYDQLSRKIAQAINDKYLNLESGIYGTGLQTELSAPLFWGIVPDQVKSKVVANLVKRVESDNNHIDVGLLGTKTILNALSENGHADLAYKVASQETFPSWGFWIKNGATTLYENWPIDAKSDISRNHIMFGEIGAWLYKSPGGLKPDPDQPGFKHILLEPHFVEGLNSFTARHISPYGEIVSSWYRDDQKICYTTIVPPNSTATLDIYAKSVSELSKNNAITSKDGDHSTIQLASGKHVFEIVL